MRLRHSLALGTTLGAIRGQHRLDEDVQSFDPNNAEGGTSPKRAVPLSATGWFTVVPPIVPRPSGSVVFTSCSGRTERSE